MARIFQNYHKHDYYGNVRMADSTVKPAEYADRAVELGHGIISSCEHGFQGRYWETIQEAKRCNLKPLISAEPYWVKNRHEKDRMNCHIFIGAMNENGRECLNDILSEANITGFYGQPRIDLELLLQLPPEDVVVTSACIAFWKYPDVEDVVRLLKKHFQDHFYLEVQYHNTESQRELNRRILGLHNELKIPLIMGCDSHFIYPSQEQNRTDFLASKNITYDDEKGWYLDYPDGDTAYARFAQQGVLGHRDIVDAMDNTNIFLGVEEYDCPVFNDEVKVPTLYPDRSQGKKNKIFKDLVYSGWREYRTKVPTKDWPHYEEEIEKEIQTVVDTNMADYFIDNFYIIRQGIENGGRITKTGRGSGVSFIINRLLGFTGVDRVSAQVKMYPERFMTTTRILESKSLPDIDFNCAKVEPFARAQREILGEDHSYPMVAYNTMKKSAAWKLYAKAQGIPFEISNKVSEQLQAYEERYKNIPDEYKDTVLLSDFIDPEYMETYQKSEDYLGLVGAWSIHPCSYLLYQGSIRREVGLVKVRENLCCLMDGHWAEDCHFLKNDILKVSSVDFIYRAYQRCGRRLPDPDELIKICGPKDPAWDVYSQGCTLGINQCEQASTTQKVKRYKPRNISELAAFIAAVRPGFKSMYKTFETRAKFDYGVKSFDDLIKTEEMPNSYILYQEQEMAALNYAGIDMSECYTAIKNIAKKRTEKVLAYKDTFIGAFKDKMIAEEGKTEAEADDLSAQLWQIIEDSASYSFNASHAYCMALDSLYCAWLKAHYPVEFYETLLTIVEEKADKDRMSAIRVEAEKFFDIKFPSFRFGQNNAKITGNAETKEISNSIGAIKGFTADDGQVLFECSTRKIPKFWRVLKWLDEHGLKQSKAESLIKIDYFADYGDINRLLNILELWIVLDKGCKRKLRRDSTLDPLMKEAIRHGSKVEKADGTLSAFYNIYDCAKILDSYDTISSKEGSYEPITLIERIKYDVQILGYVDVVTHRPEDRKKLVVTSRTPLQKSESASPWAYKIMTKSLGTGKEARMTLPIRKFRDNPLQEGDVINLLAYHKVDEWWWLDDYRVEIPAR